LQFGVTVSVRIPGRLPYFTTQIQHLLKYRKISGGRGICLAILLVLASVVLGCVVVMSGYQEPRQRNVNSISVPFQTLNGFQRYRRRRHCHCHLCRCVHRSSDVAPTVNDLPQVIRVKGSCNRSRCERHHFNQKVGGKNLSIGNVWNLLENSSFLSLTGFVASVQRNLDLGFGHILHYAPPC
jgi:hypothetical protein